jgi:hypothetical protein
VASRAITKGAAARAPPTLTGSRASATLASGRGRTAAARPDGGADETSTAGQRLAGIWRIER